MSIDSPTGILDIRNATLKVSKLEVTNATGFDTALNNIARNTILLVDSTEQTASNSWALKLPNAWVGEFEGYWASGATGNIDFNFYNNTTSGTNGYTLSMDDTTIVVKYDGTTLQTTTISSTLKTDAYRKVSILFERDTISVSVDGVRELYFKDSALRPRVYDDTAGGYITVGGLDATNRKFKNLKVVNEKWISDGTSNIACMGSIDIVGNLNLQKVSNAATIKLNSNVVTEYTRSKKFIKYPRVALTSSASNGYENGYKVTFSNESSLYLAFHAFNLDAVVNNVGWYSDNVINRYYNGTNGAYSGTTRLASETELGEWIGLEVPSPIKLYDVRIVAQSYSATANTVDDFIIYAKKQSGDTWTKLGKFTGIAARQGSSAGVTVNVNSVDYYKFFALVATKRDSQGAYGISIRALNFFGVPEYDPDADGTNVIMRSVPNVPNTDWLEVYWDAGNTSSYSGSGTTVTDLSGNGVTGTIIGNNGFDSTYNAWEFDGSGDYIESTLPSTFVDDQVHTVSLWFKRGSDHDGTLFSIAPTTGEDNNKVINIRTNDSSGYTLSYAFWNNDLRYNPTIVDDTWYHLCGTYTGGGGTNGKKLLYLNGTLIEPVIEYGTVTNVLDIDASSKIRLGSRINYDPMYYLDGSIANFRLFNRALSADEVWQLYAYQKEYFDVSPDVVTFKGGRLGIGTSEPRAVLDVNGAIKGGNIGYFSVAYTGGTGLYNQQVLWNTAHTNSGMFNTSTHKATIPVAGYWYFGAYGISTNAGNAKMQFYLRRNGSQVQEQTYGYANDSQYTHASGFWIQYCNANDTIDIFSRWYFFSSASAGYSHNGFVGFYLSS